MRKMAFISRPLALAEPVPLTLAILMTKSFTRVAGSRHRDSVLHDAASSRACGQCTTSDFCMSQAAVGQRSAHSPQCTQRSSSLTMTRPVCGSAAETYSGCVRFFAGAVQARAQLGLLAVVRDGQAVDRADVDAGIALDAQLRGEHRLHVAVEAALHFLRGLLGGEAELDLDVELLEALLERHVRHQPPLDAAL